MIAILECSKRPVREEGGILPSARVDAISWMAISILGYFDRVVETIKMVLLENGKMIHFCGCVCTNSKHVLIFVYYLVNIDIDRSTRNNRFWPTRNGRRAVLKATRTACTPLNTRSGKVCEQLTAAAAKPPVQGSMTKVLAGRRYGLESSVKYLYKFLLTRTRNTSRLHFDRTRSWLLQPAFDTYTMD